MKICLITNLYPPYQRGGAEKVVKMIANYLKKDHQVTIITTAPNKKIVQEGNLKIYYLYNWNIYHLLNDYKYPWIIRLLWHKIDLFNFIVWQQVKKILINEKPDLIWTNNLKGLSLGLAKVINQLGIKHLHQLHDLQLIDPAGTLYRSNKGNIDKLSLGLKIYCYFTKKFTKQITHIVSPSNFTLAWHKKLDFFPRAKTLVLPNPIVGREKAIIKEPKSSFNLLYLGQLEEQKGIIFLIKAFKKVNNSNLQLLIVGRGSHENIIKELIKNDNRVKFLGYLNKDQISLTFQQTDLTIVPSLCYENSPTVIDESYEQGTPVLVSDSGGQVELVEENKTGLIFKTGDEKDLIDKINYAYNNQDLINSWKNNCLETIKNYTIDKYIARVFSFIKS